MFQSDTNVFDTRVYEVKDFTDKEAMVAQLEHKINAVVLEHVSIWEITSIDRSITDKTASAKIFMKRKPR